VTSTTVESRPETISVPDVENSAEVEIAAQTSPRKGFGTTRQETVADSVSEVMPRDKAEAMYITA